jgi:leucyl-tRNA synthetase
MPETDVFRARDDGSAPRAYVLAMFAYPSGDLHMGHGENYAISDAIARYLRLRGYDVLHPFGWDAFGLPAENAARRRGRQPAEWTAANIATQAESVRRYGIGCDWSRRLSTCDVAFYRWNQWLFARMYERGLAYRAPAPVNWCPACGTVLANEQVVDGHCDHCHGPVEQRRLTQWFFRITAYADRLLSDMDGLDGWPAQVLTMQRNWIGRTGPGEYRLHDWLISRQRYWGTPIPIIHCGQCGPVPVPDADLPVELPPMPAVTGDGLRAATDWLRVPCPRCGADAERETDTMDTFVDSSWYFLRFCSPDHTEGPFDPAAVARWCPVEHYVGGVEHATGHLLFARFITKVLYDMGLIGFTEPFRHVINQGQVINEGRAMSKSLGNGVSLGDEIDRYGPDAVRLAILYAGPPGADIDWADVSVGGAVRFLNRALACASGASAASGVDGGSGGSGGGIALRRIVHRTVAEVTDLMERQRFNVAVAKLMELTGAIRAVGGGTDRREAVEALAVMLSVAAPFTAAEMWRRLGHDGPVAAARWPVADPALAAADTVPCVVQVAGRRRAVLPVPPDIDEPALVEAALAAPEVRAALGERPVARVIARPPRIVSIVVAAPD